MEQRESRREAPDVNRHAWNQPATLESYALGDELQPPERAILDRLGPMFLGRRILDLGVGGGRTTPRLREISTDYVGVDYAPRMVASCRTRFPGVDFQQGDARDLSRFGDGSFDLVMFSYNGIDYVSHNDRAVVLREMHRVLGPDGALVFSTHVLPASRPSAFDVRLIAWSWRPRRLAAAMVGYIQGAVRHARLRRFEVRTATYAILNDPGDNFAYLTHYVRVDEQIRQLRDVGFRGVEVVDLDGRWLGDGAAPRGAWAYYVARR